MMADFQSEDPLDIFVNHFMEDSTRTVEDIFREDDPSVMTISASRKKKSRPSHFYGDGECEENTKKKVKIDKENGRKPRNIVSRFENFLGESKYWKINSGGRTRKRATPKTMSTALDFSSTKKKKNKSKQSSTDQNELRIEKVRTPDDDDIELSRNHLACAGLEESIQSLVSLPFASPARGLPPIKTSVLCEDSSCSTAVQDAKITPKPTTSPVQTEVRKLKTLKTQEKLPWCEFVDQENSKIRFAVTEMGTLQEWCDGDLVVAKVSKIFVDICDMRINDGAEDIPVREQDFASVCAFFQEIAERGACVINFSERKRKEQSKSNVEFTEDEAQDESRNVESADTVDMPVLPAVGVDGAAAADTKSRGSIFEEISTGEEFVIFDLADNYVAYASLTPQSGVQNVFTCEPKDLVAGDVRFLRRATNEEIRKAGALAVRDEGYKMRRCEFIDTEGTKIAFVSNASTGTLEEWCDDALTLPKIATLTIVEDDGTIFDGEETIPVPDAERTRVFAWLRDVSASSSSCEIRFKKDRRQRHSAKTKIETPKDVVRRCEFVDVEGTKIAFVSNASTGTLEEWCDDALTLPKIATLTIVEDDGTIFDGEETIPVPDAERTRVFAWLRDVSASLSSCEIRFKKDRRQRHSAKTKIETPKDVVRRCEFVDAEGTKIAFVSNTSTGTLEEWCDDALTLPKIATLTIVEDDGTIFDGEETIPVPDAERTRVFAWLRDVSGSSSSFEIRFKKDRRQRHSAETKIETPKDVVRRCEFVDAEGTKIAFVSNASTGTLEEWCDDALTLPKIATLTIVEDDGTIFDGEETIPVPDVERTRVFAWLRDVSASSSSCEIRFMGTAKQTTRNQQVSKSDPASNSKETSRISFVDADGTNIELVANATSKSLEEWCDGTLEVPRVTRMTLEVDSRGRVVLNDGHEDIPLLEKNRRPVREWIERAKSLCSFDFVFKDASNASSPRAPKPASSQSTSSPPVDSVSSASCAFVDMEGTAIEFVATGGRLQEYCDKKLVLKSIRVLTATRDGVLNDGSEDIPLRADDRERVYAWLRDVSVRLDRCQLLFEGDAHEAETSRCEFEDLDGTSVAFVVNRNGALEEWCDGKLEISQLTRVTLHNNGEVIDDGKEEIPLRPEDRERVVAWFERISNSLNGCAVIFQRSKRLMKTNVDNARDATVNKFETTTCCFEDTEGTSIKLVVNSDGDLEEWCDGKLEIMRMKKLSVRIATGTLHDGEEVIPLQSGDQQRVLAWLQKIARSGHVKCHIEFVKEKRVSRTPSPSYSPSVSTPKPRRCPGIDTLAASFRSPRMVKIDAADLSIGDRVSIFWPRENRSYSGYVSEIKKRTTPRRTPTRRNNSVHTITYDDGDVRTYRNLNSWNWSLESTAISPDPRAKAGVTPRSQSNNDVTPRPARGRTPRRTAHKNVVAPATDTSCPTANAALSPSTTTASSASPPWSSIVAAATSSLSLAHIQVDDEIPIRGIQINRIATFIRDHVKRQIGGAMYICGSPGTGKTISVHRALRKVACSSMSSSPDSSARKKRGWQQRRPEHVQLLRLRAALAREDLADACLSGESERPLRCDIFQSNAMGWHSDGQVFAHMCKVFRLHQGTLCTQCRHRDFGRCDRVASAKAMLKCRLLHRQGVALRSMAVVVIDEIDGLCRAGKRLALGPLHQLFEWASIPGSRLVLLGIANGVNVIDRYFPRLRALRSDPEMLVFEPYTSEQIENILLRRLAGTGALEDQSGSDAPILPKSVLEFCAKKVATVSGDARAALDACRQALEGLRDGAGVGMRDMARVLRQSFGSQASKRITNLPTEAQLLFCVIAVLQYSGKRRRGGRDIGFAALDVDAAEPRSVVSKPVSLGALRVSFCNLRRHFQKVPITFDALRGMLMHLTESGLAVVREISGRSMEKQLVQVKVPAKDILGVFEENTMDISVPRKTDSISIRVDQPLQGCAIEPFTLLHSYGKDRHTISGDATSKKKFRWYRSKIKQICQNPACPFTKAFPGFSVAKIKVDSENVGLPAHIQYFCCSECFVSVWKKHRSYRKVPTGSFSAIDGRKNDGRSGLLDSKEEEARMYPDPEKSAIQEWQLVSASKTYVPSRDDVGHTLKVDCTAVSVDGDKVLCSNSTTTEVVLPVPDPPPPRQTIRHPQPLRGTSSIRIVSYNVLAEIYANKQMYPYCPLWALSWNFRKRNLMRQMSAFDADIYCLQEVQADRFEEFFYPSFRAKGFEGLYKKKTREAMGRKGKIDGCAIFYRTSRFRLLEKYVIEFNDAAMAVARAGTLLSKQNASKIEVQDALHRVMKDNVAQVLVLETLPNGVDDSGGKQFCLCNTHIFWDPQFCDVKLWQTQMLLQELEKFNIGRNLPLVLSGDFNSMPDSSVYEYLTTGRVRAAHPDLKRNPCGITPPPNELQHKLQLLSSSVAVSRREPRFTNYTRDFVGTLDYIFSSPRLQPISIFRIPTEEDLRKQTDSPLPNQQYPSDHIALCANFQFVDDPSVMPRRAMSTRQGTSAFFGNSVGPMGGHYNAHTSGHHHSMPHGSATMHNFSNAYGDVSGHQWSGANWK
eukprot:g1335.t1